MANFIFAELELNYICSHSKKTRERCIFW